MDTFIDPIYHSYSFSKNKFSIKEKSFLYEFNIFSLVNWFVTCLESELKKSIFDHESKLKSTVITLINPITNSKFSLPAEKKIFNKLNEFGLKVSHNKTTLKNFIRILKNFIDSQDLKVNEYTIYINNLKTKNFREKLNAKNIKHINKIYEYVNNY